MFGRAALLSRKLADNPLAADVQKLAQAAERCGRIVKNFLALARQHPPERAQVQRTALAPPPNALLRVLSAGANPPRARQNFGVVIRIPEVSGLDYGYVRRAGQTGQPGQMLRKLLAGKIELEPVGSGRRRGTSSAAPSPSRS